jgi:uncharacterized protein (TIGR02453 family)
MPFEGWSDEALAFYAGLEADNSKSYWTAHRATFDAGVHAPMAALLDELEARFGSGRIMRPYRDIRFSKDKRPYRTALGAMVGDSYVQISARGLGAGSGFYHLAPDQLERYRTAVDADDTGELLVGVIAAVESHDVEVAGTDALKTVPRGYPVDHPRIELLRYKGLIAWRQWPVERWLGTAAAKDRIVELLDQTAPLREWLRSNVGATTEARRRRPGR